MTKLMMTAALALALSAGVASAQAYTPGAAVFHPAPIAWMRARGNTSYSALSHNVGPGSSVTGYGEDSGNSAGSGNAPDARAPSAGNLGSGGR